MISYIQLLLIFVIAILFVSMFRLQRKFFSKKYFELSRRVFGKGITIKMILIRLVLIFFFSYGFYWLTESASTVITGVLFGSFLIVWPVLLNPSTFDVYEAGGYEYNIVNISIKGWIYLLISYVLFIISSGIIAYLSVNFGEYVFYKTVESFKSWLSDAWFLLFLAIFLSGGSNKLENLLEKDILDKESILNEFNNDK